MGENFFRALLRPLWRDQEREVEERAEEMLELFNLAHMRNEFAGTLSGGQRKLLEMARALMVQHSPYDRPGEPIVGTAAVSRAVWSPLAKDWSDLRFVAHEFVPIADGVAVVGRYVGTSAGSGSVLDAQALHLWTADVDQITRYRGFVDTYALHEAMNG